MDDIFERARALEVGLQQFNTHLQAGFEELNRSHAYVSPLWDDEMRRVYDQKWLPLEESIDEYIHRVGPEYVEFLIDRLKHLQSYLHGS